MDQYWILMLALNELLLPCHWVAGLVTLNQRWLLFLVRATTIEQVLRQNLHSLDREVTPCTTSGSQWSVKLNCKTKISSWLIFKIPSIWSIRTNGILKNRSFIGFHFKKEKMETKPLFNVLFLDFIIKYKLRDLNAIFLNFFFYSDTNPLNLSISWLFLNVQDQ